MVKLARAWVRIAGTVYTRRPHCGPHWDSWPGRIANLVGNLRTRIAGPVGNLKARIAGPVGNLETKA